MPIQVVAASMFLFASFIEFIAACAPSDPPSLPVGIEVHVVNDVVGCVTGNLLHSSCLLWLKLVSLSLAAAENVIRVH